MTARRPTTTPDRSPAPTPFPSRAPGRNGTSCAQCRAKEDGAAKTWHTRRIPVELFINLLLGLGLSWFGRDRVRADGPFAPPPFYLIATFAVGFIGPITLYLYSVHTAWSLMYLVDPRSLSALAALPMVIGQVVALLAGWYAGALFLRTDRARGMGITAGVLGLGLLLLLVLGHDRLGSYGSYVDYGAGRSLDLMDVKLGYVLVAIGLGGVAALVFLLLELARDGRRVRARN